MRKLFLFVLLVFFVTGPSQAQRSPVDYVNPLLGTATLWDSADLGFVHTHRAWGAEVFPGASLPNAMVQLSPVTQFHSGSGYQYEDSVIYGFIHTSKGHWNLCNIPIMPVTGAVAADDYRSGCSHQRESAHPGYYQVYLTRYGINAELTSTLRCAFHKYTFQPGRSKELVVNLAMANERIKSWTIEQEGQNVFTGSQQGRETMYFYAVANHTIDRIDSVTKDTKIVPVVHFADAERGSKAGETEARPLELQIGFSFVSVKNAKENLTREMLGKTFQQVRQEATDTWTALLSKISVTGGTERQKGLFYSCLYRSFLWPALRSDINGDFTDLGGKVVNKGFNYYTEPSLWDEYRNKLVLLGMLSPKVTNDVIQSLIDKGGVTGFMPTFFHGDHASVFVTGSYLRGLRGYDVNAAYRLMLKNATVEGTRKYVEEYNTKGYISELEVEKPVTNTVKKAAVTKTLEYAYDDYAVALLARQLKDTASYRMLMNRTGNYKNVFDPSTRFMRGRLASGEWVRNFDPEYPYYEYMYREANAWESSFFAPHDTKGLIALYGGNKGLEKKLDSLFTIPWKGYEADNLTGFIGQYCQGNQPDHSYPFLYTFIGKQEKTQFYLDSIMNHYYDMGKDKLAYAGMDDAGEMSSWYVFSAMGFYPFSPADPRYVVSVPLFEKVEIRQADGKTFTIVKEKTGKRISGIRFEGEKLSDYKLDDRMIKNGGLLVISTR